MLIFSSIDYNRAIESCTILSGHQNNKKIPMIRNIFITISNVITDINNDLLTVKADSQYDAKCFFTSSHHINVLFCKCNMLHSTL